MKRSRINPISNSKRAKLRKKLNVAHRAALLSLSHGKCIVTGDPNPVVAHILSKGSHPHLRWEIWNALPIRSDIHDAFDGRLGDAKQKETEAMLRDRFKTSFAMADKHRNKPFTPHTDAELEAKLQELEELL